MEDEAAIDDRVLHFALNVAMINGFFFCWWMVLLFEKWHAMQNIVKIELNPEISHKFSLSPAG